ncbi:MAG: response regulator [Pseudomonadota bacterium]
MTMTALLVEDNALNRLLFSEVLTHAGFGVITDPTGADAIAMARRHHPRVALIDLGLPAVSGLDLIRRLRATPMTRSIPVIAVSAFARTEDGLAALNAGADLFFCKPVDTTRLAAALLSLTEESSDTGLEAGSAA